MRPLVSVVENYSWAEMSMLHLLTVLGFLFVFGLTLGKGGRYERYVAVMALLVWVTGQAGQMLSQDYVPLLVFAPADAAFLAGLAWVVWRSRRLWFSAILGLQVFVLGADVAYFGASAPSDELYLNGVAVLAHAQLACLALGVLHGRIGPPARPPRDAGRAPIAGRSA